MARDKQELERALAQSDAQLAESEAGRAAVERNVQECVLPVACSSLRPSGALFPPEQLAFRWPAASAGSRSQSALFRVFLSTAARVPRRWLQLALRYARPSRPSGLLPSPSPTLARLTLRTRSCRCCSQRTSLQMRAGSSSGATKPVTLVLRCPSTCRRHRSPRSAARGPSTDTTARRTTTSSTLLLSLQRAGLPDTDSAAIRARPRRMPTR